jgi:hypothetical protein
MDINVPFLETTAVPCARLLLPAILSGTPDRYGPIRTGTADLIVVLFERGKTPGEPGSYSGGSDTGLSPGSGAFALIPLERRGKRILGLRVFGRISYVTKPQL